MTRLVTDIPDAPPRRRKQQHRFHIGFVVREAANCGVLDNGRRGNRTRSKSITVDAETLEQAINEKNLALLLKVVRETFLCKDRRTHQPVARIPRRVSPPPIATPMRELLAAKKERVRQQQSHAEARRELEAALAATKLIREETNHATAPIERPRPVRPPTPVDRRAPPVATPRVAPVQQPPVAHRRAPVAPARVTSAPRRDPAPPLAPPPPTVARRSQVSRAAVAAQLADIKHDHTAWCISGRHAVDPPARRHHDAPRPPQRPPVPSVPHKRALQPAADAYRVKSIEVDDEMALIEEFLRDG